MSDYQRTDYRLNRLSNLFSNPERYRFFLFINSVLIISFFFTNDFIGVSICCLASVNCIVVPDLILHSAKTFSFHSNSIEFDEYVRMSLKKSKYVMTKGAFRWLKISYSVSNVHSIEFHQNPIEKIFDIGHISFQGDAVFSAKRDIDRIKEKDLFTIYGIRNFAEFKLNFQSK